MTDSDPLFYSDTQKARPNDFTDIVSDAIVGARYKFFLLLALMFFVISSDVFINRVLISFVGAVNGKYPTNWGTFLQGLFLVITCVMIDILINQKII